MKIGRFARDRQWNRGNAQLLESGFAPEQETGERVGAWPTMRRSSHFSRQRSAVVGKRGGNSTAASSTTPATLAPVHAALQEDQVACYPEEHYFPTLRNIGRGQGRRLWCQFRLPCKKTESRATQRSTTLQSCLTWRTRSGAPGAL